MSISRYETNISTTPRIAYRKFRPITRSSISGRSSCEGACYQPSRWALMMVGPDLGLVQIGVHHPVEDDRQELSVHRVARVLRRNRARRAEDRPAVLHLRPARVLGQPRH